MFYWKRQKFIHQILIRNKTWKIETNQRIFIYKLWVTSFKSFLNTKKYFDSSLQWSFIARVVDLILHGCESLQWSLRLNLESRSAKMLAWEFDWIGLDKKFFETLSWINGVHFMVHTQISSKKLTWKFGRQFLLITWKKLQSLKVSRIQEIFLFFHSIRHWSMGQLDLILGGYGLCNDLISNSVENYDSEMSFL